MKILGLLSVLLLALALLGFVAFLYFRFFHSAVKGNSSAQEKRHGPQ
jgi:type II secretory pathway component PulJ